MPHMTRHTATIAWTGAAMSAAAVVAALVVHGAGVEGWRHATAWTARVALLPFVLAFAARPLAQLTPVARPLLHDRRGLGLAFAAAHAIHGIAIVRYFVLKDEVPAAITLIGGGFAYVLLAAMALTSTDAAQRRMGRGWRRLHLTGMIYLWLIFAQSYIGRLFDPASLSTGLYGTVLLMTAMALRLAAPAFRRARSAR